MGRKRRLPPRKKDGTFRKRKGKKAKKTRSPTTRKHAHKKTKVLFLHF